MKNDKSSSHGFSFSFIFFVFSSETFDIASSQRQGKVCVWNDDGKEVQGEIFLVMNIFHLLKVKLFSSKNSKFSFFSIDCLHIFLDLFSKWDFYCFRLLRGNCLYSKKSYEANLITEKKAITPQAKSSLLEFSSYHPFQGNIKSLWFLWNKTRILLTSTHRFASLFQRKISSSCRFLLIHLPSTSFPFFCFLNKPVSSLLLFEFEFVNGLESQSLLFFKENFFQWRTRSNVLFA